MRHTVVECIQDGVHAKSVLQKTILGAGREKVKEEVVVGRKGWEEEVKKEKGCDNERNGKRRKRRRKLT